MVKKSIFTVLVSVSYFLQAQDISTIKNTAEVYTDTDIAGTAKYSGLAGSIGALGGDISSLNSNPAGIGVAITGSITGSLSINTNTNTSTYANKALTNDINDTNLGQVGGILSFPVANSNWKFVNLGFNYTNKSIENYIETAGNSTVSFTKDLVDASNNPVTGNLSLAGHAYDRYGSVSKTSIALGGNYDNKLFVGGSLNFYGASIQQYDSAKFLLDLDNSTSVYDQQYTPYTEESSGTSLSAGFITKVNNQLRVGAALETPTFWKLVRNYTEYTDDNGVFYDNYDEDRTLSSPMKATLSAAFVPNKNFSLNVDYVLGLTKPKYKVQGDAESELNDFFSQNYKNTSEIKVGGEYRINNFRLRAGYANANSPFNAINGFSSPYIAKRETIAGGVGYSFKSFFFDASYQNITSKGADLPFAGGTYFSNDFSMTTDNVYQKTKVDNTQKNIMISIGWKF